MMTLAVSRRRDMQRASAVLLALRERDGGARAGHRREANVALAASYDALARRWAARRWPGTAVDVAVVPEGTSVVVRIEPRRVSLDGRAWFALWFGGKRSRSAHLFAIDPALPGAGEARTACDLLPFTYDTDVRFGVDESAPKCDGCRTAIGEAPAVAPLADAA